MEKYFFNEVENKEFKNQVRQDIVVYLEEERKTNVKLNKRLNELELDKFILLMKDIDSYCSSELATKLRDVIWLYSYLVEIDEKMEFMKQGLKKYFEHKLDKEKKIYENEDYEDCEDYDNWI